MSVQDIVLPFDMPLRDAHDIGEALQLRLEGLEDVERAYVHLDFEGVGEEEVCFLLFVFFLKKNLLENS